MRPFLFILVVLLAIGCTSHKEEREQLIKDAERFCLKHDGIRELKVYQAQMIPDYALGHCNDLEMISLPLKYDFVYEDGKRVDL